MPSSQRGRESARATRLPKKLTDHFQRALESHDKLMQVARLSAQGISMHLARPNTLRVLAKAVGGAEAESYSLQMKRAEEDALLAKSEIDEDFPVLNGFVAIAMWSWLEDFVKGAAAIWLVTYRPAIKSPAIARLKVRLGDYLALSRFEQALHIIELLDQDTGSGLKSGVNRFKGLLDSVGLQFDIDEEQKKKLYEFQMIRNNLAHRNGVVDQRLRQSCPWLGFKLGQRVRVSQNMVVDYSSIGAAMLLSLLYYAGDVYGLDLREVASPSDHGTA